MHFDLSRRCYKLYPHFSSPTSLMLHLVSGDISCIWSASAKSPHYIEHVGDETVVSGAYALESKQDASADGTSIDVEANSPNAGSGIQMNKDASEFQRYYEQVEPAKALEALEVELQHMMPGNNCTDETALVDAICQLIKREVDAEVSTALSTRVLVLLYEYQH